MSECTRESGTCEYCRAGCPHKPGWFMPGEAEKAAEFMSMTLPEFFRAYLAVDWWEGTSQGIFVLSPAIEGAKPGTEFPGNPLGSCVFYKDERCAIHPVKPRECVARWCGDREPGTLHEDVAMTWKEHQGQVAVLLGREPESSEFGGGGLFGLLGL